MVSNFIFINPSICMHVPVQNKVIEKCFTVPYIVAHLTFSKWTIDFVYKVFIQI